MALTYLLEIVSLHNETKVHSFYCRKEKKKKCLNLPVGPPICKEYKYVMYMCIRLSYHEKPTVRKHFLRELETPEAGWPPALRRSYEFARLLLSFYFHGERKEKLVVREEMS